MPNSEDEVDQGGRSPVVTDDEILRALIEHEDPVCTSSELADDLPINRPGVYKRLRQLEDEGLVTGKKIGPGKAWWITNDGRNYVND